MYLDYVLHWPDDGCSIAETCRPVVNLYLLTYSMEQSPS